MVVCHLLLVERHLITKRTPINLICTCSFMALFPHTHVWHTVFPEPYILGELQDTTASEISMVHGILHIFFRNNTFLLVKIGSWNFQHLFDLGFRETLQNFSLFRQTFRQHFSTRNKSCPNELKSYGVSRKKKSKRCWKFQISILTNKKLLFLRKY